MQPVDICEHHVVLCIATLQTRTNLANAWHHTDTSWAGHWWWNRLTIGVGVGHPWLMRLNYIILHNEVWDMAWYGYVMQLPCSVCTTCSSVFCCFQILLSSTLVVKQEQLCLARSGCSGSNLPPSCWHFKQPQTPKKLKKHFGLMGLIWLTVSWKWFVSTWVIPKLVLCHHHRK